MRKITESDLVGKTVKSIDNSSVNVLRLIFTDDSKLELWADDAVATQYGNVPGIFVDEAASNQ
jgi:hypothetical protein